MNAPELALECKLRHLSSIKKIVYLSLNMESTVLEVSPKASLGVA